MSRLTSSRKKLSHTRQSSRRQRSEDSRRRKLAFEELEDRRLLAVNFVNISNSLNSQLLGMQAQLTSALNDFHTGTESSIPMVGDSLGNAAQVVSQFNSQLQSALSGLGTLSDPSDSVIQNALANTPFLVDRNGNGVGADDVLITRPGGLGSEGFAVQMRLQAAETASLPIDFDTGLPSLPLSITANGSIDVSVGFAFELAFTYDSNSLQVALDTTKTLAGLAEPDANHPIVDPLNPLAIFVSAVVPGNFNATATVGFVKGSMSTLAGQDNALFLTAMANNLTGTPTLKLDGVADTNLQITGSFAGTGDDFPGIDTQFHMHWSLSSASPEANPPQATFDNVNLDLGRFLSNVVGPVLEDIQQSTVPLEPVLQVLGTTVPGISDLSNLAGLGDVTLLQLAGGAAQFTGYGPLYDLANKVIGLIDQLNSITVGSTVRIPLGGFNLDNYDLRTETPSGEISDLGLKNITDFLVDPANIIAIGQSFDQIVANLPIPNEAKDVLGQLTAGLNNGFNIEFPILDDPAQAVFDMLLGKDADLFYLTADAEVQAQGEVATGLQVFNVDIVYGGNVDVDFHFKFAYDTFGLRELINDLALGNTSNIAEDIADGFYIDDTSYFNLGGQIYAGVGISVAVFSAKVGGFISTDDGGEEPVSITIDDPNNDGKLRFSEFQTNPFDVSGRFSAALGIEVRVGVEILGKFVGWKDRFDIANVVLIDLNPPDQNPPPEPCSVVLASQPDEFGTVELYIGDKSSMREGFSVSTDDEDDQIIIRLIETIDDTQTIEVALRQEFLGIERWVTQEITGVKKIAGVDNLGNLNILVLPGVNVDVDLRGGQGRADIWYNGEGSAFLQAGEQDSYLDGGQGLNTLLGGQGNDTLVLGPGGNLVAGGAGDNTIVVATPYTDTGLILGGSDPNAENTVVVVSGAETAAINALPGSPGSIELNYQQAGAPNPSPNLILRDFSTFVVSAQDRATDITIGDLSPAGVTEVIVNIPAMNDGGRHVTLDTKADSGASQISIDPFVHTYYDVQDPPQLITHDEIVISNATTGVTTYLLGMRPDDVTTIRPHGGTAQIGQLLHDQGTLLFDAGTRQTGAAEIITMTTPVFDLGNNISSYTNGLGQFVIDVGNYPTLIFSGQLAIDSIVMNVAAPGSVGSTNVLNFDASALSGALIVNALGNIDAQNDVTLSAAGPQSGVAIRGGSTTSSLLLGTGQLAAIKNDVTATNVQLTIDDSAAPVGSLLTLTAATFGSWVVPGLGIMPRLDFSGLRGPLESFAGAGDRYQLDVTPVGVTSLTMHNDSSTLDPVYTADWAVPLMLLGNFAFYAGQGLLTNGTVDRVKRLNQVAVPVTLAFNGVAPTEVVLDGDLDPSGAQYTIDGLGILHVVNSTVGLNVTITGFRDQDALYIYMPGATVAANLQRTSPGTIYIDGTARLAGTNPTAADDITIEARYGDTEMTPLGTYNSRLDMFNDVYLLGSMPQDDLTVNVPTNVVISMAQPTTFDIQPIAQGGTTYAVSPARTDAVIAWIEGAQPGSYWNFILPNPPAAAWDSVYHGSYPPERYPNPLGELPYGVDVLHEDAGVGINYYTLFQEQVAPGVFEYVLREYGFSGTARYFLVDPNPVATDNNVQLDASQLRGNFNFNITGPDYQYVFNMMDDSLFELPKDITYPPTNYTRVFGNTLVAFGQSNIVLNGAHPELSVDITSENRPFTYSSSYFPIYSGLQRLKSEYAGTTVYVGEGTLANVQGQVSVDKVWLKEVDGRQGTQPNILTLTSTELAWTGASGAPASLTMGQLYGELTITGSPFDRIAVEGTPNTAWRTTIRNFATSEAPVGVYVMAKTVMPLEVTGNFELYVGQRLNADGSVTAVGQVRDVFSKLDTYHATGYPGYPDPVLGPFFSPLYHNLKLVNETYEFLSPTHIQYRDGSYNDLYYTNQQKPLPVFYTYTGAGQGKLVFDAHDEQITGLGSDYFQKFDVNAQGNIHGISTNYLYPGMADLRFYRYDVLYGPNAEVFMYGPHITQGTSSSDPAPAMLLDNPFTTAVHYIANPDNTDANVVEEVLIGNVYGPVYVEGSGRATRVEINPLYSLPTGTDNNGQFESINSLFPGWGRGRTGGFSLIDTIHADVTITNAALRVIADIPLPSGFPPVASRPDVALTGSEIVGIAGSTIHFSNLVNSITASSGSLSGILDIGWSARYVPGLSIQLPAHAAVSTDVQDTPAGTTTLISTLLSASDTAMTDGPITVRGTTGPLVLGQLLGPTPAVNFGLYGGYLAAGQPIGDLVWGDGLSVPQVLIGDAGSLQHILGPVFVSADSHQNSPLVTTIDGRNDASRPDVSFTQPTYIEPPSSIVSSAYDTGLSRFYQQVDGLAPAPIYFGDFFKRPHSLEVYGSAGSTYTMGGAAYPVPVPPTMKLFTGADGNVVYNSNSVGPMSIIGATSVQLTLGNSVSIAGYTGPPQIFVEQDPAHPQPTDLHIDRHPSTGASPTLNLTNAGNGLLSLTSDSGTIWWRVFYAGANTQLTIDYGIAPLIVSDTGAAGTEISPGTGTIDVYGTTGPLTINPSGNTSTRTVRLGQSNNMQAILGDVEIRSNAAAPLGFTTLTLNNSADSTHRDIHLATDVDGNTLIAGMAPGLIKLVGDRFTPTLTGGTGGSTWYVDSAIFPQTSNQFTINGGATSDLLVGPDLPNTWTMDATNSVRLEPNVRANNMFNLRGGADADLFRSMNSTGTIAGDLDGGGGFNTLEYVSVPNPFVTDLVGGTAPRIGGMVQNIHAVIPEQLSFIAPGSLSNLVGDGVSVQLTANSTIGGTLTYGASGLPNGLAIDPSTGLISGTIAADADLYGPYHVTATVSNGADSRLRAIDWAVTGPLRGDYNNNGVVDAADYTVWRDALTAGSTWLPNDPTPGVVDESDFLYWRAHFGETMGAGSGAGQAASLTVKQAVTVDPASTQADALPSPEPLPSALVAIAPTVTLQSSKVVADVSASPSQPFVALPGSSTRSIPVRTDRGFAHVRQPPSSDDGAAESIRARALLAFLVGRPGSDHFMDSHEAEKWTDLGGHNSEFTNERLSQAASIDAFFGRLFDNELRRGI